MKESNQRMRVGREIEVPQGINDAVQPAPAVSVTSHVVQQGF
jgi:hypothetical protein